ncbi:MAG: dihydrofolate reductase family protein [Candidatus Lustribacter sp.]
MASGISGALVTTTTFSGTGSIGISSGLQGFSCGSGNTANFVFNVPLTGSGGVEQEGNGYLALYANNTYTGGTELTGGQIIYYNNNNSFGTGPIAVGGSNGALVNGGSAGITIPNNFTFPTAGYALNLAGGNPSGSTPGTTFSGNFSLPSGTTTLQTSSTATEVTEVSGIISGSGAALAVADNGTLILAGPNTYSGLTTLSSGTLQVASMETPNTSGPLGQSPVSNPGSIVLSGGTLQYSSANHNDYSGRFSTAAGQAYNIDVNGQTVAFATALTSSGAALTLSSTAGGGSLTLSAANTYSGNTTINAGTLTLSGAGDLGDTGGSSGSYAANITDNGTFIYHSSASQTLSGAISGSGALVQSGPGPLTINGADSSTGAVTISGGTLFLGSGGSLVSASAVSIAAGATFDVSAYGGYPLSSGTLSASGTASPATLNGPSGGFLDLLSLPIALTYDGAHAPLAITYSSGSGTLLLNGNTFQVNNASGLPLVAGAYPIIQTSGTISSPVPCFVDVTGSGLAGGLEALIQVNGANVDLVVQALPNNVSPVWNGADSGSNPNWSDVNNWVNQDAPFPDGDNVTFTGSTGTAPVMDSSYSVQSLTFDNNTTAMFTLNNSGSVLGVYVGVTNNSAFPQVLDTPVNILSLGHGPSQWNILNPGVLITVNNPVSDDGNGLAVSGNGTLELAGANTFTGGITTASGSTLEIDGSGDLGDNGSGSGFYAGAITNNGTFIYSSFASQTFSGPVIVNGTFTDNSSAAQTFAGSLTINVGGTFTDSSSAAQTFPVSGIVDNGMINYNSSANQSFPTFISGSGSLTVNGNGMTGQGQLDLKATNTYTGTTTVNDDLLLIGPTYGDASLGTPPSSPVANQLILNNNMNNGANNFGLVDNGGNPSTLTLSANRGIFLGANGGCISCYPGATMYVTLEPHDHESTMPRCSVAVIEAGIARVVVGALDPNVRTHGQGVERLRGAGVAVDVVEDPASLALIERFAYTIGSELPFVTLKMAMSLDGYISPRGGTYRVTGEAARERVNDLRAAHDAVMVGAGTVRVDDPLLTIRPHRTRVKPYARVVVAGATPLAPSHRVFAEPAGAPPGAYRPTIVLAPEPGAREVDLRAALIALRAGGIETVLCEGGPALAGNLLAARLVERIVWFVAPAFLRTPGAVPVLAGADLSALGNGWAFDEVERVGNDLMITARLPHV